jgi:hypothetical protein
MTIGQRLEQYTLKNPQEVLLVTIAIQGEEDEIAIFKGFSSSLTRPTNPDPDIPVIPETATIVKIDRCLSPYDPLTPRYIQQNLSLGAMETLL